MRGTLVGNFFFAFRQQHHRRICTLLSVTLLSWTIFVSGLQKTSSLLPTLVPEEVWSVFSFNHSSRLLPLQQIPWGQLLLFCLVNEHIPSYNFPLELIKLVICHWQNVANIFTPCKVISLLQVQTRSTGGPGNAGYLMCGDSSTLHRFSWKNHFTTISRWPTDLWLIHSWSIFTWPP